MLPLIGLIYLAVPFIAAVQFWRKGHRVSALGWMVSCAFFPALATILTMFAYSRRPAGEHADGPGEAYGLIIMLGVVGVLVWFALTVAALTAAARARA